MAYYRRRSYGSYRSSYRYGSGNVGLDRAIQHKEEAARFSAELGGIDRDVKEYFFSLPPDQRARILDEYGKQYGSAAKAYAERTLPEWRSGLVTMSGQNAKRLFSLLPPRMPISEKYKLTEKLWRHFGPRSRKLLRVGLDARVEDAVAIIRNHVGQVVIEYNIPEHLEQRFNWLSAGDVHVKQRLLNHFRQLDKTLAVEVARAKLPVMLTHMNSRDGRYTHRLAEILKIGKHELEIVMDKNCSGVKLEEPSSASSSDSGFGWLWWLIGGAVVLFLLAR